MIDVLLRAVAVGGHWAGSPARHPENRYGYTGFGGLVRRPLDAAQAAVLGRIGLEGWTHD